MWGDVAYDTIEQYTAPTSDAVVARLCRWYPRRVVEGGRKEKMLRKREYGQVRWTGTVKFTTQQTPLHRRGQTASTTAVSHGQVMQMAHLEPHTQARFIP
jgi:hypothetical protein